MQADADGCRIVGPVETYCNKQSTGWLGAVRQACYLYLPVLLAASTADPDDELRIDCASEAQADRLLRGDKGHVVDLKEVSGIPIVSAPALLQSLDHANEEAGMNCSSSSCLARQKRPSSRWPRPVHAPPPLRQLTSACTRRLNVLDRRRGAGSVAVLGCALGRLQTAYKIVIWLVREQNSPMS